MDQAWIDACRTYSALDEAGRLDYWSRLTEDQRTALTNALAELSAASVPPARPTPQPTPENAITLPAPSAAGCGKTLGIGCGGIVLGALLTIAVEVVAVYRGVDAFSDKFNPKRPAPSQTRYELARCSDTAARQTDAGLDRFCRDDERSHGSSRPAK